MNALFLPYEIVEEWPGHLHLKLNNTQKWLNILLFRVLPMFLFFMVPIIIAMGWKSMPWFFLPGMVIVLVVAGILGTREIITEIVLTKSDLKIVQNKFIWSQEQLIPWKEVEQIKLRLEPQARGGRGYYSLINRDGKATLFAVFPIIFQIDRDKYSEISKRFQELSGLPVLEKD